MSERPKLTGLLGRIDAFIEREVAPLEAEHPEFFDHRREFARSDLERGGAPIREWEEVLVEMMRRADAAGLYRFALPAELGGSGGTNLEMAVIREHLANKPIGLHFDLQSESACVGNFPVVLVLHALGSAEQRELIEPLIRHELACGLPTDAPGFDVRYHHWTFNMPTDHSEVELRDARVPDAAIIGEERRVRPSADRLR